MENNEPTRSKYDEALAKFETNLNDADIAAQVAAIIEKKVPENNTMEVKKFLFHCIDLTTLNTTDNDEKVMNFTKKVNQFDEEHPDMKNVAAICVYPNFAEIVRDTQLCRDCTRHVGSGRRKDCLRIRWIPLFTNLPGGKSSRNGHGPHGRGRRDRHRYLRRQILSRRL